MHPGIPAGGQSLAELFKGRSFDIHAAHARMKTLMEAEGLEFKPADRVNDTRLAQELSRWADSKKQSEIHTLLFRAHFVDGLDLSNTNVLVQLAVRAGFDQEETRTVLDDRFMQATVDTDWSRARQMGITGVPTFVTGRRGVVGAQPYEALEQLVTLAGATRRSNE